MGYAVSTKRSSTVSSLKTKKHSVSNTISDSFTFSLSLSLSLFFYCILLYSPPSAKYQAHLPLRVSREVINETVERKGVSCTHVDALRFFAQDALPLNNFGVLERSDQVTLEQPACVHANMDLLKIALKLQPFCDTTLLGRVLSVALEARKLDVAASPYDASEYDLGVIPIDTPDGRAEYRTQQRLLMTKVQPVRQALYHSYSNFLSLAFDDTILEKGSGRLPSS